jgi:hypothetical protein
MLSTDGKILWSLNLNAFEEGFEIIDMVVLRQHPPHLLAVFNSVITDDSEVCSEDSDSDDDDNNNACHPISGEQKKLAKLVSISSPFHSEDVRPHLSTEYLDFHVVSVLITPWMIESEDNRKSILFLDDQQHIHVYNPMKNRVLSDMITAKHTQIYFQSISLASQIIHGYILHSEYQRQSSVIGGNNDRDIYSAMQLWTKNFAKSGEILLAFKFSERGQLIVNSIYRTGERGSLYKYLNPHLLAIASIEIMHDILHIYLLDGITGRVILHTYHDGCLAESVSVSLFLYENKFLYSFYNSQTLLTEVIVNDLWLTDPNSLPSKERTALMDMSR